MLAGTVGSGGVTGTITGVEGVTGTCGNSGGVVTGGIFDAGTGVVVVVTGTEVFGIAGPVGSGMSDGLTGLVVVVTGTVVNGAGANDSGAPGAGGVVIIAAAAGEISAGILDLGAVTGFGVYDVSMVSMNSYTFFLKPLSEVFIEAFIEA